MHPWRERVLKIKREWVPGENERSTAQDLARTWNKLKAMGIHHSTFARIELYCSNRTLLCSRVGEDDFKYLQPFQKRMRIAWFFKNVNQGGIKIRMPDQRPVGRSSWQAWKKKWISPKKEVGEVPRRTIQHSELQGGVRIWKSDQGLDR